MNSQTSKGAKIVNSSLSNVSTNSQQSTNGLSNLQNDANGSNRLSNGLASNLTNSLNGTVSVSNLSAQSIYNTTQTGQKIKIEHCNSNLSQQHSNHPNQQNSNQDLISNLQLKTTNQTGQLNNQLNFNSNLNHQQKHQTKLNQANQSHQTNQTSQSRNNENKQLNQTVVYDQICNSLPDSPETTTGPSTVAIYDEQEIDEFLQQQQLNSSQSNNQQNLDENIIIEQSFINGRCF